MISQRRFSQKKLMHGMRRIHQAVSDPRGSEAINGHFEHSIVCVLRFPSQLNCPGNNDFWRFPGS